MARIIVKRIRFGKAQRFGEAAGATTFILIVMVLLHPLYAAITHMAYYAFVLMLLLSMWGRALDEYQYA